MNSRHPKMIFPNATQRRFSVLILAAALAAILFLWSGAARATLTLASDAITSVGNLVLSAGTSIIDVSGSRITNVGNSTGSSDALNQDSGDTRYVNVSGDTMTGDLAMGANDVSGVSEIQFSDGAGFLESPFDQTGIWSFTREAANPVIAVSGSGDKATEQYVPNCAIVSTTTYCYVKGTANIYGYSSTDGITFTALNSGNAVISPGEGSAWDNYRTWPQEVWYDEDASTFHMLYIGRNNSDQVIKLGYATSADGTAWTKDAGNPVMDDADLETAFGYADIQRIGISSVVKIGGTYYGYGSLQSSSDSNQSYTALFYATTTDFVNWTPQKELIQLHTAQRLVEDPNSTNSKIIEGIQSPDVFRHNGLYHMTYTVRYDSGTPRVELRGWAVSPDGVNWTHMKATDVLRAGSGDDPDAAGTYAAGFLKTNDTSRDTLYRDASGNYRFYYSCGDPTVSPDQSCLAYLTRVPLPSHERIDPGPQARDTLLYHDDFVGSALTGWTATGSTPGYGDASNEQIGVVNVKTAATGTAASYIDWGGTGGLSNVGNQKNSVRSNRIKTLEVGFALQDTIQLQLQIGLRKTTPPLAAAGEGFWLECNVTTGNTYWKAYQSDSATDGTASETASVYCNNTNVRAVRIVANWQGAQFYVDSTAANDGWLKIADLRGDGNMPDQSLEPFIYLAEKEAVEKNVYVDYVDIEAKR